MKEIRRLAVPAYVVAGLLMLFTLLDYFQPILPVRFNDLTWRVGSIGLISRMLVAPFVAFLLAYAAALVLEQPRSLRLLALVNFVFAVLLAIGLPLYVLDALQLRVQVNASMRNTYEFGLASSTLKFAVTVLVLLWLGRSEWKAAKAFVRSSRRAAADASVIVPRTARPLTAGEGTSTVTVEPTQADAT
jgi:hypothetical protein